MAFKPKQKAKFFIPNVFAIDDEVIASNKDPFWILENQKLFIKTKTGEMVPFVLNTVQTKLHNKIKKDLSDEKMLRYWILKARQLGISTYIEALMYCLERYYENTNSVIIADDVKGSNYLLEMFKLYHEKLESRFRFEEDKSNEKKLSFKNRHSQIIIDTANNLAAGRKFTFRYAHLSEVAFFPDAATLMVGLNQSVPTLPRTIIIGETTANGRGGYFYMEWQKAKKGESDWEPIFFAWFEMEEYRMPVPEGFKLDDHNAVIGDNENDYMEQYGLDLEQMVWRRWIIRNKCNGDVKQFNQEYPADDHKAFISSGHCRFNTTVLERMEKFCQKGKLGYLEEVGKRMFFREDPKGWIEVFEEPKARKLYIGGFDTSEGIEVEGMADEKQKSDYSAGYILGSKDLTVKARIRCRMEPDVFAEEIRRLATWYNKAFIGVERNKDGLGVLKDLKNAGYDNIYYHESFDPDVMTKEKTRKLGWVTDKITRPLMISHGDQLLREGLLRIVDIELLNEMLTFVRYPDGSIKAQSGCFDDLVMSYLIALQMQRFAPSETVEEVKKDLWDYIGSKESDIEERYNSRNLIRKKVV